LNYKGQAIAEDPVQVNPGKVRERDRAVEGRGRGGIITFIRGYSFKIKQINPRK
jgi:hypothetical protein